MSLENQEKLTDEELRALQNAKKEILGINPETNERKSLTDKIIEEEQKRKELEAPQFDIVYECQKCYRKITTTVTASTDGNLIPMRVCVGDFGVSKDKLHVPSLMNIIVHKFTEGKRPAFAFEPQPNIYA